MSASFQIDVKDHASPAVRAKIEACSARRLYEGIAPRLENLFKRHFRSLPSNKKGWPSTGFWGRAANATNSQLVPEGVLVSVNQIGARQRFQGGPIKPVNAKALTIPVSSESYGKTPADFGGELKLIVIKGKGAWLAKSLYEPHGRQPRAGRKSLQGPALVPLREKLQFLFRLSSGVEQAANPNVLPPDAEITREALLGAEEAVR